MGGIPSKSDQPRCDVTNLETAVQPAPILYNDTGFVTTQMFDYYDEQDRRNVYKQIYLFQVQPNCYVYKENVEKYLQQYPKFRTVYDAWKIEYDKWKVIDDSRKAGQQIIRNNRKTAAQQFTRTDLYNKLSLIDSTKFSLPYTINYKKVDYVVDEIRFRSDSGYKNVEEENLEYKALDAVSDFKTQLQSLIVNIPKFKAEKIKQKMDQTEKEIKDLETKYDNDFTRVQKLLQDL